MDIPRYSHANALREAGRETEALEEFEAQAEAEPDERERNELIRNQANCLWRLGRLKEARQRLCEAEKAGRTPAGELLDAYICVSEGNTHDAEQKLIAFVKTHADLKNSEHEYIYFCAQHELGKLFYDLGRFAEAVARFSEALAISDGTPWRRWLCFHLGVCYYATGEWNTAIEKLTESLPEDQTDSWWAEAQYYLGICHSRIGKFELAEKELLASIVPDKTRAIRARTQYELGYVYFRRGAYLKAKHEFELSEFFLDDPALRQGVAKWLVAVRAKLGERVQPHA